MGLLHSGMDSTNKEKLLNRVRNLCISLAWSRRRLCGMHAQMAKPRLRLSSRAKRDAANG